MAAAAVLGIASPTTAHAASANWTGNSSALWSDPANWSTTPVPGHGNTATFNGDGNGYDVIDLGTGQGILSLHFNSGAVNYTIGSGAIGSQTLRTGLGFGNVSAININNTSGVSQFFAANVEMGYLTNISNNSSAVSDLNFAGNISGSLGYRPVGKSLTITASQNATVSISGIISDGGSLAGAIALTKAGNSTLNLSAVNTYSGNTAINEGTIRLGVSNAIPSGTGKGNLAFNPSTGRTATLDLNGFNQTLGGFSSGTTGTSVVDNRSDDTSSTFTIGAGNGNGTYSGVIRNSGSNSTLALTKIGTGTISLTGNNTYFGNTAISEGVLSIGSTSSLPGWSTNGRYSVANSATLAVGNSVIDSEIATILGTTNFAAGSGFGFDTTVGNRAYSANVTDTAQGALNLLKTGNNTLTLSGVNTYSGSTTVSGGTLLTTLATALPGYNTAAKVQFNGGTIAAKLGDGTSTGWSTAQVDSLLANASKTSGALGLDTTNGDATQWTTFTTANFGSALGLTKLGNNTLILDQANSYAGDTTIREGTIRLGVSDAIPSGAGLGAFRIDPSTGQTARLDLNGSNQTLGGFSSGTTGTREVDNTASDSSSLLTIGANNGTGTFSGTIQNTGSNSTLALTKVGTGTISLTGNNTYRGNTAISEGVLSIGSAASLPGSSIDGRYSVASGATLAVANTVSDSNIASILGTTNFDAGSGFGFDTAAGSRIYNNAIANTSQGALNVSKFATTDLTLGGNNTYTGITTINNGRLIVTHNNALGSVSAGTVVDGRNSTVNPALVLSGNTTVTGESLALVGNSKTNVGSLPILSRTGNGTATWAGDISASGGSNSAAMFGGSTVASHIGKLVIGASSADSITLGTNLTLRGTSDGTNFSVINSTISGVGHLLVTDNDSRWKLTAANSYVGPTMLAVGILAITNDNNLGAAYDGSIATVTFRDAGSGYTSAPSVTIAAPGGGGTTASATATYNDGASPIVSVTNPGSGYLSLPQVELTGGGGTGASAQALVTGLIVFENNPFLLTTGTLQTDADIISNRPVYIERADATIDTNGFNSTFSGIFNGLGGLNKTGSGTLNLTGANTYGGNTMVSNGILLVNNTLASATGTGNVTVNAGATLGGNGTASGQVNVSGTLAAGNSIGTITTGNLFLTNSAVLDIELGCAGSLPVSDRVQTIGTVNLADGADLKLTLFGGLNNPVQNDVFFLIANDGVDTINGVFTKLNGVAMSLNEGSTFTWNSQQWEITYQANAEGLTPSFTGGNDLAIIQIVPEPGTWALFGLAGIFLLMRRRKASASHQG